MMTRASKSAEDLDGLTCKSVGINICRKPESRVTLCETFGIYYIGFDDMYAYKLNIREKAGEDYNDSSDPIIAQYASPIEILKDGWRLD